MQAKDKPTQGTASDERMQALDPCQDALETLYNFLDGELTQQRREEIQHHLDECSPCLQAFGFEADLKALVAMKCRDEAPDSLRMRIAKALGAETARGIGI